MPRPVNARPGFEASPPLTRYAIPMGIPALVRRYLLESDDQPAVQYRGHLGNHPMDSIAQQLEDFLATKYTGSWDNVERKFRIDQTVIQLWLRIYYACRFRTLVTIGILLYSAV